VAVGTVAGNVAGGWLGDRLPRALVCVASNVTAGVIGAVVFGAGFELAGTVALAAVFGVANASGRPSSLALAAELSPRHRGAIFGLLAFTNQSGVVVGASLGSVLLEFGGYVPFAVVALTQGVLSAALAVPLVFRRVA
jgi:MFS family permease